MLSGVSCLFVFFAALASESVVKMQWITDSINSLFISPSSSAGGALQKSGVLTKVSCGGRGRSDKDWGTWPAGDRYSEERHVLNGVQEGWECCEGLCGMWGCS